MGMNIPSRSGGQPTLEDVAREATVSTATVSRCLNSPEQVSAKTRERVMAAVERLRYTPNFGARALAAKRTNTFGAIIPTMDNAIFARGLQAFQEALSVRNATMLVASTNYDPDLEEKQIRNLVARGADGLLLIGDDRPEAVYDLLRERGIPVVVAWALSERPGVSCVGFDNRLAARQLADAALALGHRTVAMISAHTKSNDRARARLEGIRQSMTANGIDPKSLRLVETNYSIKRGMEAAIGMLRDGQRPTLIMCGNDVLAAGAVMGAKSLGLDVPGDVSVTGFDDIELAMLTEPGLTTVHVPHRQMGRAAAQLLLDHDDSGMNKLVCLDTSIVERGSLSRHVPGSA
ncbi:MAG: LacI family DNA-binding transcriptional regulator [Nitratireductor sp.]